MIMANTFVRQLLKDLCINSPWSYAIFWKLQQHNHMVFTYEDGYCYFPNVKVSCQSIISHGDSRQGNVDFEFGRNLFDGHLMGYPIRFGVTDIAHHRYEPGEGLVGRVAASGNDLWIYSDDSRSIEFMSKLEFQDESLLPVFTSFKTTLVVPILPHGVLQLGSLEKVVENPAVIADIKDRFIALRHMTFSTVPAGYDENLVLSTLIPELEKDESSFDSNSLYKALGSEESEEINTTESVDDELSNSDQIMLPIVTENFLKPQDVGKYSSLLNDKDMSYLLADNDIIQRSTDQCITADLLKTTGNMRTSTCHKEGYSDDGVSSVISNGLCNYLFPDQKAHTPLDVQQAPTNDNNSQNDDTNLLDLMGFPGEYELHEILGPTFLLKDHQTWNSYDTNVYFGGDLGTGAMDQRSGWFGKGDADQEHLLEAIVTTFCNNSDDITSYRCSSISSLTSEETAHSSQVQISYKASEALAMDDSTSVQEEHTTLSWDASNFSLTSPCSFESLTSAIMEDEQAMKSGCGPFNKNTKVRKLNRNKTRQKSSHKARPRDRQLIQDRLNELRGLVPNGDKCSIDGLLDKTIKHMMFLQSVTYQAEEVQQFSNQECKTDENNTSFGLEMNENHRSCPIIVKDLEQAGHILIQMICNNDEVFFEMAEVMHQLKLTILKGVMKTSSNNWANFIVQTSVGFNRLDIFWPLMRILQRNGHWTMNQWFP